jgi:hypothetical protein
MMSLPRKSKVLKYFLVYVVLFPSHLMFEGGKADMAFGLSPNFHATHSFVVGSGSGAHAPPIYTFGAIYGNEKVVKLVQSDAESFTGKHDSQWNINGKPSLHVE